MGTNKDSPTHRVVMKGKRDNLGKALGEVPAHCGVLNKC